MALKVVTATFTGAEDSVDVTWPGISARHHVSAGVCPSDGGGTPKVWLTNHSATGATVNTSARFSGTVKLFVTDAPTLAALGTPKAWRSTLPVPTAISGATGGNRVNAFPISIPSDVASITLRGGNRTFNAGVGNSATVDVAFYASDGSGSPTGAATAVLSSLVLPGGGTMGSFGSASVAVGADKKSVMVHSFPNVNYANATGCDNGTYALGTLTVNPAPAPTGANPNPVYWWNYGYSSARRRVLALTDSIGGAFSPDSSVGFQNSSWIQLMQSKDWAVNVQSVVQYGSLQNYANVAGLPFLWDQVDDILPNADVLALPLGTNDLAYADLSIMQTSLQAIITHVRSINATVPIVPWTIPPQAGYPGTDTIRTDFNTWLKANYISLGCSAVYDAAAPQSAGGLANNSNPNAMATSLVTSDNTHPNIAGQTVIANGFQPLLS